MALQAKKVHDVVTLASITTASGLIASTNTDAVRLPGMVNALALVLDLTAAATDGTDTLDVKVQTKVDGTNWMDVAYFTQVVGTDSAVQYVAKITADVAQAMFADAALTAGNTRNILGDEWRVNYTQVDAVADDASFTFRVTACPM